MARPKKDNAEYFPHDAGMRNDDRVKALRKRFKLHGYAIWIMLIEYLTSKDFFQFEYNDFTLEIMAGDFDADVKEIQEVIAYCITLGLLQEEGGFIRCKTLRNRLEPVLLKRKLAKDRVSVTESTQSKVKESKVKESIIVAGAVCSIFGKHYLLPEERLPAQANFFRTIDEQAKKILTVWEPDTAVKQIKAYLKHCKNTQRKVIATDYKVAETILSCDWVAISGPEPVPKGSEFAEAEYNRKIWTEEAWLKQYDKQIKTNPAFQKHFQITP